MSKILIMNNFIYLFMISLFFSRKKFNYFHILIHRFLRYAPLLVVAGLYQNLFLDKFILGPLFFMHNFHVDTCKKYWWSSLLMIENFVNATDSVIFKCLLSKLF